MPHPAVSPPLSFSSSAEEDKFNKLQQMLLAQEKVRMAREDEREARLEAERKAAAAKVAKEEAEKKAAEALAEATKKAKAAAEAEAETKAKTAAEEHKKALDEAKAAAETAKEAEEAAKKAEEVAKKEAAAAKPPEAPIKFKDAVGRKFSFPWQICKTWKVSCESSKSSLESQLMIDRAWTNSSSKLSSTSRSSVTMCKKGTTISWAPTARSSCRKSGRILSSRIGPSRCTCGPWPRKNRQQSLRGRLLLRWE
jgi:hypothetical protein